jgi:uncharacterized protein (DUF2267 family)
MARTTRRLVQTTFVAAGVVGLVAALAPETRLGRATRRLVDRFAREMRYAIASTPGLLYHLAGRQPDPNVSDDILADRIRSSLGPLEKRLDIPRVHVMVDGHVAIVHGDVPNEWIADRIEYAILGISGVSGVESHLHMGLVSGDTRPSEGRVVQPSEALRALLDAARQAGASADPRGAVHAVLCGFSERIPEDERRQVFAHLPADVRALAGPARRHGVQPARVKTVAQLVAAVIAEGAIDEARAEDITRAVVATLRTIVPEEARDVAAVLPHDLRGLWEGERATR